MDAEEVHKLFDLSTVAEDLDKTASPTKFVKRIITITRPVLQNSTVCICSDDYVRYDEVEVDQFAESVKFNIVKPCGTRAIEEGHSPCMPSLRLDMLEREYSEPVRNRNKDWILDSQRPIINEKGNDIVSPKFSIPLGKYKQVDTTSKQFWAKEYQTMLREVRLMRTAAIISETNCIVEVHGVGFSGRMFSEGSTSPKLLVIEAYSIWNSQKYTLVLTVMELRLLLVENPELLRPGRRADLLKVLVKSLYFKYTITIPPKEPITQSRPHSKGSNEHSHGPDGEKTKKGKGPTKRQLRLTMKQKLQKELLTHEHAMSFDELHHTHTENTVEASTDEPAHPAPAVHVPHIHFINTLENAEKPIPSELLQLHPHGQHHHSHHPEHHEGHHSPRHSPPHTHAHPHAHGHAHVHALDVHVWSDGNAHDPHADHNHHQGHQGNQQHISPRHRAHPHSHDLHAVTDSTAIDVSHSPRRASQSRPASQGRPRTAGNATETQLSSQFAESVVQADCEATAPSPQPLHSQSVPYFQMDTPLSLNASLVTDVNETDSTVAAVPASAKEVTNPIDQGSRLENTTDTAEIMPSDSSATITDPVEVMELAKVTVSEDSELNELMELLANNSAKGSTKSQDSTAGAEVPEVGSPREGSTDEHSAAPEPLHTAYVQQVSHLDPPVMPRGYPTTVEQMIRLPPVLPENSMDPLPIVTQELHIGPVRLYNGIKLRKLQAVQKRVAEEKEEQRLLAIWLATPKRQRNLVGIRLVRRCNYLVLISGYFDPLRPNTILLKGMVYSEATKMSMFLGLGKIRDLLHIETPCQAWSRDELKVFTTKVLRYAGVVSTDFGGYALNVAQSTGLEAMTRKKHTVSEFLNAVRARQRPILYSRMHDPDSLSAFYTPLLEESPNDFALEDLTEDPAAPVVVAETQLQAQKEPSPRPAESQHEAASDGVPAVDDSHGTAPAMPPVEVETAADQPRPETDADSVSQVTLPPPVLIQVFPKFNYRTVANELPSWCSLGACQSIRCPGKTLGTVMRPLREIGRSRRLSSKAVRVGHVHCIYTLYANTSKMTNYREAIPIWPVRDPTKDLHSKIIEPEVVLEEEEDQDFMKAASDSDGSDSDSDAGGVGAKNKKKKKATGEKKGVIRSQSDDIDLNDVLDGDGPNETDEKNDAYASLAEGLVLELYVYVPAADTYQETCIPSGTFKMCFSVNDLDKIFPAEEKEFLARALRAVYFQFFDRATAEEVRTAETDWEYIGRCILRKASWIRRVPLSPAVATATSDVQQSQLGIDLLQDLFDTEQRREYIRTLLYADAEWVPPVLAPDDGALSAAEKLLYAPIEGETAPAEVGPNNDPYVTLTWSNVVHRKAIKVRSATSERGETVLLQVQRGFCSPCCDSFILIMFLCLIVQSYIFQIGESQGVVCFDRGRDEVYFAQHSDEALLQSHIRGFRFISGKERSLQLYIFLTTSLTYAEVPGQVSIWCDVCIGCCGRGCIHQCKRAALQNG